jgi:addiction module RelE/StbE family toxin
MKVRFKPLFLRQLGKLPAALQEEAKDKIALFKRNPKHQSLKVHKLKGRLRGYWSFSVNYKYRIVYEHESKNAVALVKIGDHSIYE